MSACTSALRVKAIRSRDEIMAKIKLTTNERTVIPDIMLRDEDGGKIENRSMPAKTRIEADITHANPEERMQYLGTRYETTKKTKTKKAATTTYSDIRMESCIRKHVHSIRGCLSEWYRDGNTLWDGPESREQDAIISSLFYRILGMQDNEDAEKVGQFNDDGPADLTAGEN